MSIKIKLTSGTISLDTFKGSISRSEVYYTKKDVKNLLIFDKLDQDGNQTLTENEIKIANENYEIAESFISTTKNEYLHGKKNSSKDEEIRTKIAQINSRNVHAILAGFQIANDKSNTLNKTISEWNARFLNRRAGYTPLTLPQAIINSNNISADCKKECLHKILDAVEESSRSNRYFRNDEKRLKYVTDLRNFIETLDFSKNDTNADLMNALMYVLMPNNGCVQDWKNILSSNNYDVKNLYQ